MSHPECRELREKLGAFMDGELPASETERVRRHLEECAACRRELEEMASAETCLRSAPPPDPGEAYWREFGPRLRARMAREKVYEEEELPVAAAAAPPVVPERTTGHERSAAGGRRGKKRDGWWILPWSPSLGTAVGGLAVAAVIAFLFLARDLPFSPGEPWRLREERPPVVEPGPRADETGPSSPIAVPEEEMEDRAMASGSRETPKDMVVAREPAGGAGAAGKAPGTGNGVQRGLPATAPVPAAEKPSPAAGALEGQEASPGSRDVLMGLKSTGYMGTALPQASMEVVRKKEALPLREHEALLPLVLTGSDSERAEQALALLAAIDRDAMHGGGGDVAPSMSVDRRADAAAEQSGEGVERSYRAILPLLESVSTLPLPDSLALAVEAAIARVSARVKAGADSTGTAATGARE